MAATVVVLAGGDPPHRRLVLPRADVVVAADGGAASAAVLGLRVDVLVGDLDSIDGRALAALEASGTEVQRHPRDKDATDLALALDVAAGIGATRIVVVGGHGGRLDHSLAAFAALAAVARPERRVEAWMGEAQVIVAAGRATIAARVGELVSLLPLGGPARGVTTTGLRWALDDAELDSVSTLGVSNEAAADPFTVSVADGVVAAVRPHALAPDQDRPDAVPDRAS